LPKALSILVWRAALVIYTIGYFVYLGVAGWSLWQQPELGAWDWIALVSWESVYALAWPVLVM